MFHNFSVDFYKRTLYKGNNYIWNYRNLIPKMIIFDELYLSKTTEKPQKCPLSGRFGQKMAQKSSRAKLLVFKPMKNRGKNILKKSLKIVWKFESKCLIFAPAIEKQTRLQSS